MLLREWLQEMGYQVTTDGRTRFAPSTRQHMLLVYPGEAQFTKGEADRLLEWVEDGGTAVIVGHADRELEACLQLQVMDPSRLRLRWSKASPCCRKRSRPSTGADMPSMRPGRRT